MNKILLALSVSIIVIGGFAGSAEAYSVEATFYLDGVDIDTGEKYANPAVLLIVVGSPDKIEQLLKPQSWTLEFFDHEVDFYFGYDPTAGITIAVRNDEDPASPNVTAMGINPTSFGDLAGVEQWSELTEIGNPAQDIVVLQTDDGRYFKLWNFMVDSDLFTIAFDVDEITELNQIIPEPSTLLLLGLGLLGLIGLGRRKKNRKMLLKILLLPALAAGLSLSSAEPVAAQTFDCSTVTQIPQAECEALVAFYDKTDGTTWNNYLYPSGSPKWLSNSSPCDWGGLTCTSTGHVQSITLSLGTGVGPRGPIPPEIGDLTELDLLHLSINRLSGEIPPEIGNLTKLTWLSLEHNKLSGNIPPELGNMKNLKWLNLKNNQLSGAIPAELGNLTNLLSVTMGDNQLNGAIPAELGNLTNLLGVTLSNNQLSGVIPIDIWAFPNLEKLDLSHNQLEGNIASTIGQTNLEHLNLSHNKLNGPIPMSLGQPRLEFFDLSHNQLSGEIPTELGDICKDLSTLRTFNLSYNQLNGEIPSELGNLPALREDFNLSHNQLSGPIPPELGNLTFSGEMMAGGLLLNNNNLSGKIPSELGNLSSSGGMMRFILSLANNPELHGPLPAALTALNSFQSQLYFNGTKLCEPQDTEFQDWLATVGDWQGSGVACPFPTKDIPQAETDGLVALYNSTGGDNWANTKDIWLTTGSSPCDWFGVTCAEISERSYVTGLDLNDNNLNGFIPPGFGNLTALQSLALNNNQLSGSLPANLTQLTALTTFDFSNTTLCEPQDTAFQTWLDEVEARDSNQDDNVQSTGVPCTSYLAEGGWQDANKTEADDDDDDLCWAAAAANILEWGGWDAGAYDTAEKIMNNYEAHWENKKGSPQDAWNWWLTGAEPGYFGDYSDEWAHVDESGGGGYWTDYDFNEWYEYSDQMADIPALLGDGYGVVLTLASDNPTSDLADNHAITLWGYEEYDDMITDLWVTDSDDLSSELFRLQVMQQDGLWYLAGGDLNASYGYGTGEWYIDEIHALKQKSDLVPITTSTGGSGTISPASPLQVPPDSDQWFTIAPASGSLFVQLLVDGNNQFDTCTEVPESGIFRCPVHIGESAPTIVASFETASGIAMIASSAGSGGSISPSGTDLNVAKGTSRTYTITPDDDYTLTQLRVNGVEKVGDCPVSGPCAYTFANVASDSTIAASFQLTSGIVPVHAWAYEQVANEAPLIASGGSISPDGYVRVQQEQDQTFTMLPESTYQFVDVYVKSPDESIWRSVYDAVVYEQPNRHYTFENLSTAQEIKVRFAKKEETIIEIKGRCLGPYGQIWDCSKITKCVGDGGQEGIYKSGVCKVIGPEGEEIEGQEIDVDVSVSIADEEYDLATGFRVSLSEAYALFLEYQGQDFEAWEQCETHEQFEDGIAYTEETLCVSAALSFGSSCSGH